MRGRPPKRKNERFKAPTCSNGALRNAVSSYIKENNIDEGSNNFLQVIYDTKRSKFTLQRAPLLLAEKIK